MAHILIVEDDSTINNLIFEYLTENGCTCRQAFSGTEGRMLFDMEAFDLMLLDLMIPGMSGEELITHIRAKSRIPVIILSAKAALEDKVGLLGSGADDYLTKPFELEELWARIQVQLRRSGISPHNGTPSYAGFPHQNGIQTMPGSPVTPPALQFGSWTLDRSCRTFTAAGCPVDLTAHEFGMIELFMKRPKKVFTKQEIFEAVWQQDYFVEDKTINVHISNIRAKLRKTGTDQYIRTVWGIGFRLSDE